MRHARHKEAVPLRRSQEISAFTWLDTAFTPSSSLWNPVPTSLQEPLEPFLSRCWFLVHELDKTLPLAWTLLRWSVLIYILGDQKNPGYWQKYSSNEKGYKLWSNSNCILQTSLMFKAVLEPRNSPTEELEGGSWLVEGRSDSSDACTGSSSCWLSISRPASELIILR